MKNKTSKVYKLLNAPNGAELLFTNSPDDAIHEVIEFFVNESSPLRVQACAFLCRAVKKKRYFDIINEQVSRNVLYNAIKSDNNKLRKNTIILLGRILNHDKENAVSDVQNLTEALENESVLMVVPSIILALGVSKNEAAYRAINEYKIPATSVKKHENEIKSAIRKAKENYSENAMHEFVGLGKPYTFELRVAENLAHVLNVELIDNLFFTKEHSSSSILVTTDDYERLFSVRSFREILLPIGENIEFTPQKIAAIFCKAGKPFVIDAHTMTKSDEFSPFRYRIELRADKRVRRNEFIAETVCEVQKLSNSFVNSVSGYEIELRIEQTQEKCNIYIKLFTVPDNRFNYRVGTIPASITPANAAALVRAGKMKLHSRVLDFCCGSGTLLIERAKVFEFPIKEVVGVDISSEAISIAKKNLVASNIKNFSLLNCDCRNFYPKERFDEVYANLPFGNRVNSHDENLDLYKAVIEKLPNWLNPDGVAVLYSADAALLKKLLKNNKAFNVLYTIKTEAGGLQPVIFVLELIN